MGKLCDGGRHGGREETEYKRINSAKILRAEIDAILDLNINANIIILGDFNDEPQNISLEKTLKATNNRTPENPLELFNAMYEEDLKGNGTNNWNYEWYMLDNIIISQNLLNNGKGFNLLDENNGQIFKQDWLLYHNAKANTSVASKTYGGKNYYGGYSDHLAVYLILDK